MAPEFDKPVDGEPAEPAHHRSVESWTKGNELFSVLKRDLQRQE